MTTLSGVYQNGGTADPSQVQVFVGVDDISQLRQDQIYNAANVYTHPDYSNQQSATLSRANQIEVGFTLKFTYALKNIQ